LKNKHISFKLIKTFSVFDLAAWFPHSHYSSWKMGSSGLGTSVWSTWRTLARLSNLAY